MNVKPKGYIGTVNLPPHSEVSTSVSINVGLRIGVINGHQREDAKSDLTIRHDRVIASG